MTTDDLGSIAFRNGDLPEAEQFEAWRALYGFTTELSLVSAPCPGFDATAEIWNLGSVALSSATMPGAGYRRRYRRNRRCALDHWYFLLEDVPGIAGIEPLAAGNRVLRSGSLSVDYDECTEASHRVVLYVSRDLCPEIAPALDGLTGTLPEDGMSGLMADFMLMVARGMPDVRPEQRAALVQSIRSMIVAMASRRWGDREPAASAMAVTLHERARRIIRQHLTSSELTPERLCRAIGVSRSNLYRMFEYAGGVAAYVQRQKLLAALSLLSDPACALSITAIGMSFGFEDTSTFSRAFKREFGVSPSEAREAGVAGVPILVEPPSSLTPCQSYETLLRQLQT